MSGKEVGRIGIAETFIFWEIKSFSILQQKENTGIWSPVFNKDHADIMFCPFIFKVPNGSVGLIFKSRDMKAPLNKSIRLGVVDETKNVINCCEAEWIDSNPLLNYGYFRINDLCQKKTLSRSISVQLFCELINKENGQIASIFVKKENASETDAAAKAIANTGSAANVSEKSSFSPDEDEKQKLKNLHKLAQNFQELYVTGKHTDVTIKVKDRDFTVHKVILAARSPVFDAMFTHRLSESNTGIVPIEECEPAVFEEFLFFIYTGKIQQLSSDNACDLYYVADKYQISELKEECVRFLKKSMTIETICDIICLSTKCNEAELLDFAINFFARNVEEILVTVKWQLFMEENPTKANELTLKALKLGFVKRQF